MELPRQPCPWSSNMGYAQVPQPYQAGHVSGGNFFPGIWPPGAAEQTLPMPLFRGPAFPAAYAAPISAPVHPELKFRCRTNMESIEVEVQKILNNLKPEEARTPYSVLGSALGVLGLPSLYGAGVSICEIPSLSKLAATEARVSMLLECYIAARHITTLHDMEREVVSMEGVKSYLDLGLGRLQDNFVVKQYFPGAVKVFRITTADVLQQLCNYMKAKAIKDVNESEFLKYLAEAKSQSPQHLGVLLRNVRVYAEAVSRAQQQEQEVIAKYSKQARAKASHADKCKPNIIDRVSSFLKKEEGGCTQESLDCKRPGNLSPGVFHSNAGKTGITRINSKPAPHEEQRKRARLELQCSVPAVPAISSCPYPSAAEEQNRLKKRRCMSCAVQKAPEDNLQLCGSELAVFLEKFNEACEENTVHEILTALITEYGKPAGAEPFAKHPLKGLLNIAIIAQRSGLLKEIDFSSCKPQRFKLESTRSSQQHLYSALRHPEPTEEVLLATVSEDMTSFFNGKRVKRISKVFGAAAETFLGVICICECLIKLRDRLPAESLRKFTAERFCRLLKRQWHLLPKELTEALICKNEVKEVVTNKLPQHTLPIFLRQAFSAAESEEGFLKNIGDQIENQFKLSLNDLGYSSSTELLSHAKGEVERGASDSTVVFSGAITTTVQAAQALHLAVDPCIGPITARTALQCLEGAPLLSDLAVWSQWELVYSPVLGSLLDFVKGEHAQGKLEVLITTTGSLLRINKSATLDSFVAAIVNESSRDMAGILVSLFAVWGGIFHTPRGLLQNYAAKGISLLQEAKGSRGGDYRSGMDSLHELGTKAAANCVLECLNFIPLELHSLAAEILLPAVEGLVGKKTYSALLEASKTSQSQSILHRLGLIMGNREWICDFFEHVATPAVLNVPTHLIGRGDPERELPLCTSVTDELLCETEGSVSPLNTRTRRGGLVGKEASAVTQLAREAVQCEMVVAEIRHEEFGLDDDVAVSHNSIFVKQNARMGRALNRLSCDLYSEDSHFVLELVQNADDNEYEPGTHPTLVFIVGHEDILVLNNEVGFTEANLRALCDVGKSTKEGRPGYIGHKGIGFKSVFKVTEAPEIHSNGFHVKFDTSVGSIGFILPTWVDPIALSPISSEASLYPDCRWNTCIRLPLKDVFKTTGKQKLASKFELDCSILLFLKRIQSIAVENHVTGCVYNLRKESVGEHIVRVVHSLGSIMSWLVVKEQLGTADQKRAVPESELVLAFPLQKGSSGDYSCLYPKQKVFAFLPLREYGLKFVVQGSFTLTSSREDVDRDCTWNEWLLSNVPNLFLTAAGRYRNTAHNKTRGQAVTEFMGYVPLEGEVLGFFSPLPRLILAHLRVASFLPVEGEAECAMPCFVLRGWDSAVRTVVSPNMLRTHLGLQYLDKDVQIPDALAASLGVHVYGMETLFSLMASICQNKVNLNSLGVPWLRSWFVLLHDCLLRTHHKVQDWKGLTGVDFIPLSDGTYASRGEGNLWFAGRDEGTEMFSHFPALLAELRIVHPSLMGIAADSCEAEQNSDKVKRILSILGVQHMSSHQVMKTHILTSFKGSECVRKDPALVVEYLSFTMLHLLSNCQVCRAEDFEIKAQLKNDAVILTNNGLKRIRSEPIHFSQMMGNPIQVRIFLENTGVPWNEVDSSYLDMTRKGSRGLSLMQLRTFFSQLGVTDFLQIQSSSSNNELKSADWHCPELVAILSALCHCDAESKRNVVGHRQKQLAALLTEIDRQWDESFGMHWSKATSADAGPRRETTFVKQLRTYPCMRSSLTGNLHLPTLLFDRSKAVEDVLGTMGPYALPEISSQGLKEALGLRTNVSLEDALGLLKQWQLSGTFEASPSLMGRFYSLLWQSKGPEKDRVMEAMSAKPSIFLPHAAPDNPDQVVSGNLFLPQDTVWDDITGALDALCGACKSTDHNTFELTIPLKRTYPALYDFFVAELQVRGGPSFDMYFKILLYIARSFSPYEMQKQVVRIFKLLSQHLDGGTVEACTEQNWRAWFGDTEHRVFPTLGGEWVSLHKSEGFICLSDNAVVRQDMSTCTESVHFLLLDDDPTYESKLGQSDAWKALSPLLRALNVPLLSEAVDLEVEVHGRRDGRTLLCVISWSLQYMQRYLAKHRPNEYTDLQHGGVVGRIRSLKCEIVERLLYRHVLQLVNWASQPRDCPCLVQCHEGKLYVEASFAEDYGTIYKELTRLFLTNCPDLQLANFLHLLTLKRQSGASDSELENFVADVQGIPPLPNGDDVWCIPEDSYQGVCMASCMPRSSSRTDDVQLVLPTVGVVTDGRLNTGNGEVQLFQSDGWVPRNDRKLKRHQAPNELQQEQTGRAGEAFVYQHLVNKHGATNVTWVNEAAETGAAFDIVVELQDGSKEFVEVKSTRSSDKDWFELSAREWEFAQKQGEKYTIVRVQLGQKTRLLRLPNPVKMCHSKGLQLALMLPDSAGFGSEYSIIS